MFYHRLSSDLWVAALCPGPAVHSYISYICINRNTIAAVGRAAAPPYDNAAFDALRLSINIINRKITQVHEQIKGDESAPARRSLSGALICLICLWNLEQSCVKCMFLVSLCSYHDPRNKGYDHIRPHSTLCWIFTVKDHDSGHWNLPST